MAPILTPDVRISGGNPPCRFILHVSLYPRFFANGTLDLGVVPGYAKYTVQQGVDTIILGGSTGEWPSMTSNERLACLHAWRAALDALPAAVGSKPKILFHAGDVAVERAVALAKAASGVADEILIVSPCIMKPGTPDMLLEVLGLVSAAAPTTPAWYYHCERRVPSPLSAAGFSNLHSVLRILSKGGLATCAVPRPGTGTVSACGTLRHPPPRSAHG